MNNKFFRQYVGNKISINGSITWLLDVDDTILDLSKTWLKWYNHDYDDDLTKEEVKTWAIGDYTKIGDKFYDYLKYRNLYEHVDPVENALEGVNFLRSFPKARIVYCTHVMGHPGQKYDRLKQLGLLLDGDGYFEGFSNSGIDKNFINADVLIDDGPKHILKSNKIAMCFTQPWNMSLEGQFRVSGWIEFMEIFK